MRFKKSKKAVTETHAVILSIVFLLSFFVVVIPAFSHGQTVPNQKLDSLIKKLQDPDKEVRLQALEGLRKLANKIAVPPLIDALKDSDQEVRTKAAEALGRLADERMVPPLIDALKDPEKGVRTAAARTLGGQYDKRAVPPLIEALKDPDEGVRSAVAWALGHLNDKRAVLPLIEALKDPRKDIRSAAASALGYLNDKRAVPTLIEALKDSNENVRSAASGALGRLGDKTAVPPLIEALKDADKGVRLLAAEALGKLGDRTAVPPLIDVLEDSDGRVRSVAARALGRLGDKAAVQPLIAALKDPDKEVRGAVARALGQLGEKAAVSPLMTVLKNDPDRGTRCQALMALRDLGSETPPDLRWVCELGPPPPPPPFDLKGGDKVVAFWNTWFEIRDEKSRVEVLKKDATYTFVLDISKYAYFSGGNAESDQSIIDEVNKARQQGKSTIRFRIRPILYGDFLRFTDNQRSWEELKVDINKLILADKAVEDKIEKKKEKLSSGEIKLHDFAREVQAGEVRFDLLAERPGKATILITIWDEKGMIPLDHLSLSVRVVDAAMPTARWRPARDTVPLRKGRQTLLNVSSDFSTSGPLLADAAFYVFEKSPKGNSIVLFAAKAGDAAPGAQDKVSVNSWETQSLLSEYIEKKDQLIVQIRDARKRAISKKEYSYQLAAEGLKKKIFGGLNKRDREQAAEAEKVFRDLVQKKAQKSTVFVRMRNEDGNPVYLPLGILAASSSSRFLDKRIILVQPLPREHYPAGVPPVGSWTFNMPEKMDELFKPINNDLNELGKDPPYRRDISTVKGYFETAEPADPSPGPEGVLLLAHQAGGNLWFANQAIGIVSEDIKRPFPAGSVAILSACSTASSEGNNQAILEKLNANGIDAMIISPFPVDADYGAMLAIKFVKEIEKAKEPLSMAELFSKATEQTAIYFRDKRGRHLDDMDLEFLIAGDYRIKIAPKKEDHSEGGKR